LSDNNKNARIAIIGGGVAGLTAALRLSQAKLDCISEIAVFEKYSKPGGLLQSTRVNGCFIDNGLFKFTESSDLVKLFPDLFCRIENHTQKVWHNNRFDIFPYNARDMLRVQTPLSLGLTALDIGQSFLKRLFKAKNSNLHDWLSNRLTKTLLEQTKLEEYLKKLQGLDAREISAVLGEQRLKHIQMHTRPLKILKSMSSFKNKPVSSHKIITVDPKFGGTGAVSQKLAELCQKHGVKIHYNENVVKLEMDDRTNFNIYYDGNGCHGCYYATHIISTMPLDELVEVCRSHISGECIKHAFELSFMDMF